MNIVAEAPPEREFDDARIANAGPWGRLELVPLVVAPTAEFTRRLARPSPHPLPWRFPGQSCDDVEALLEHSGFSADVIRELLATATVAADGHSVSLLPAGQLLRHLTSVPRAKLYAWLASAVADSPQAEAFRYFGAFLDEWFDGAPLRASTIELIRPYVYRQGGYLLFADLASVAHEMPDEAELLRLTKTLHRDRTTLVRLHVGRGDDVEQLIAYWGRGGREDHVRPLLESLAGCRRGQEIDIVHLLPAFARRHLYTYPRGVRSSRGHLPDCFWTALNFFSDAADDRLLDPAEVQRRFARDWRYVAGTPQFGDIGMFHDEREIAHHAAVYLADDLYFTKNGALLSQPWLLTPREQLQQLYWRDAPLSVRHFRRVDLC